MLMPPNDLSVVLYTSRPQSKPWVAGSNPAADANTGRVMTKRYGHGRRHRWQQVAAGLIDMPSGWEFGPLCEKPGHTYEGKSVRRKDTGACIACELDLERPAPRRYQSDEDLIQLRRRAMGVKAGIEDKQLSKEEFAFGHLAGI